MRLDGPLALDNSCCFSCRARASRRRKLRLFDVLRQKAGCYSLLTMSCVCAVIAPYCRAKERARLSCEKHSFQFFHDEMKFHHLFTGLLKTETLPNAFCLGCVNFLWCCGCRISAAEAAVNDALSLSSRRRKTLCTCWSRGNPRLFLANLADDAIGFSHLGPVSGRTLHKMFAFRVYS